MSEEPNLDEIDDLVNRYVFSANFDGDIVDERRAIHEWVNAAILAERERCADVARRYLEDIAGCNINEDEPEKIAAAIMDPKWEPPLL